MNDWLTHKEDPIVVKLQPAETVIEQFTNDQADSVKHAHTNEQSHANTKKTQCCRTVISALVERCPTSQIQGLELTVL